MTTNFVNDVISFLTNREGNLHEISAAIGMDPNRTSTLLGGLLRSGTVVRTGRMRKYIYRLAPDYRTPEQIYQERLKTVLAVLHERQRLSFGEVRTLIDESSCLTRSFLEQAVKRGEFIKQGKQGYFLTFKAYEAYIEDAIQRRKAKREVTKAAYREIRRNRPHKESGQPVNVVCDECRQNWQGYQIHKIFGSARA
ncbi:DUF977 family protein [Atlantibacter hermannii]|uniref:DUF977 family protein n=1 Tax=Atlantibacter hermannii TaxID=565 RepID=UPI0028ADF261|nr:DUF977 family protein [Atlantibacter hermannii]